MHPPRDIETLKQLLTARSDEYEEYKKILTDSSDIYTYYFVYGKQVAYQEIFIILDKMAKTSSIR